MIINWYDLDWLNFVASVILTICILIVTYSTSKEQISLQKKISDQEANTKKLEFKISLFDKRYKVYFRFRKYYDLLKNFVKMSNEKLNVSPNIPHGGFPSTRKELLQSLILNNMPGREETIDNINNLLTESEKTSSLAQKESIQRKINFLNGKLFMHNLQFLEEERNIIGLSKFCYPDNIAIPIISIVEAIHKYIDPFLNEGDSGVYDSIVFGYKEIQENDIIKQMEDLLILSKQGIDPS